MKLSPCSRRVALFTLIASILPLPAYADSAIFFHPDGMGVNTWTAVRNLKVGPDGSLEWDKLPHVAVYKGHVSNGLTPSSNGGATIHAYGTKATRESYGIENPSLDDGTFKPQLSIAHQALAAGKGLGLVNSGSIIEPGTGAFVARVKSRKEYETQARQVIESGAQVILSGGEEWLLPEGISGTHGKGKRSDMRNLIKDAQTSGYTVVYNAQELAAIDPKTTTKLLGVFAAEHTFNDQTPEFLADKKLPLYKPDAPTIAEMTDAALRVLQAQHADNFLLVVEEEGTDNFGNVGHLRGQLEAGKRADDAIGVMNAFMAAHPNASMFTTSDSDAGGLQLVDCGESLTEMFTLSMCTDGEAYQSAPDANGHRYTFNVMSTGTSDVSGGVVIRGAGKRGNLVKGTMDNTKIYELLKKALFGDNE